MTNAYRYLIEAGGLEEESSYPYTGKRGECKFESDKIAVRVVNFTTIPVDEDQIAAHLVKHGPLAGTAFRFKNPVFPPLPSFISYSFTFALRPSGPVQRVAYLKAKL